MNDTEVLNEIAATLNSEQDVAAGKWFGKSCLKVGGKVFATHRGQVEAFRKRLLEEKQP
jgi:hypothetical protein